MNDEIDEERRAACRETWEAYLLGEEGGWGWRFPEIADKPSAKAQAVKIAEELDEVQEALFDGHPAIAAVEAMDVIHAAETLLRILDTSEPDVAPDAAYRIVVRKNGVRGYYGEEDGE